MDADLPARGYQNPVIAGFHPDPSVCRVGDTYYLATSSFTFFPGVPVFRSTNLVDWVQIGNALDRPSQLDLSTTDDSSSWGIFAPTLRHHAGRFWMITTLLAHRGLFAFFVTADDPAGPWSDPTFVPMLGIDPDLCWDSDGNCWLHYAIGAIHRCRIDDRSGEVLEGPVPTWSGAGLQSPEAPHLYERDGTWYLLIAEGGTERGHAVSVARGPSPVGPWEPCPANPILSHRSTDHPIQNTGHADIVTATDGTSWMVLLGVRPKGVTPGFHVLGRETFLVPVEWRDGWPVVGSLELDMPRRPPGDGVPERPPGRDDFDGSSLHPRWLALRRPAATFALLDGASNLVIDGTSASLDDSEPAYIGRRQEHLRCTARTRVTLTDDGEAGLAMIMDNTAHYEVVVGGARIVARLRLGEIRSVVGDAPRPAGPVVLRLETDVHTSGPDTVRLGFETESGTFTVLGEIDGRYLSTEVQGGFIGRTIGMFAAGCRATFAWFDYSSVEAAHGEAGAPISA
jgi:xylan 1,4-beta-xylosidase